MDACMALFFAVAKPLLICFLPGIFLLGVLALISPGAFRRVMAICNYWVDTSRLFHIPDSKFLHAVDKWVDTDRFFMPYIRVVGIAALLGAAVLSFIYLSA